MKRQDLLVLLGTNSAARVAGCSSPSVRPMMAKLGFQPLALLKRTGELDELWMPCQAEGLAEYLTARRDPNMDRARLAKAVTTAKTKAAGIIAKRAMHQKPETFC